MNASYLDPYRLRNRVSSPLVVLKNINWKLFLIVIMTIFWVLLYRLIFINIEAPFYVFSIIGEIVEALGLSLIGGYIIYFITSEYPALQKKIYTLVFIRKSLPILYKGFKRIISPVDLDLNLAEIDVDYFDGEEYKNLIFQKIMQKIKQAPSIGGMREDRKREYILKDLEKKVVSIHREVIDEFKKRIESSWHLFDHEILFKLHKMMDSPSLIRGFPSEISEILGLEFDIVDAFCQDFTLFVFTYNLNLKLLESEIAKYD